MDVAPKTGTRGLRTGDDRSGCTVRTGCPSAPDHQGKGNGVLPMSGDFRRHPRHDLPVVANRSARARRTTATPVLECLEGRQLLTVFTGFSHIRNVVTPSGVYTIQVSGPGILKAHPAGNGSTDIKVLGTTVNSTLTISQTRPRFHAPNGLMSINSLTIGSGQIGSIIATQAELDGAMTPLTTSLTDLELGAVGPSAQIDVNGDVGTMTLGSVALGPGGHILISDDLSGGATIGSMSIVGGQFVIGRDSL